MNLRQLARSCGFDHRRAGYRPDRADALVWALTTLVVENVSNAGLMQWYEQESARLGLTGLLPGHPVPEQPEHAPTVKMIAPRDWTGTFYGIHGARYAVNANEVVDVGPDDVPMLQRRGFELCV